jgi:dihydropteroate synthase
MKSGSSRKDKKHGNPAIGRGFLHERPTKNGRKSLSPSTLSFAGLSLDRPIIMGIINVTPDSFSDGGEAFCLDKALQKGREQMEAGAEILDVGGCSTRPGATEVPVEEELRRVVPVVRGLAAMAADTGTLISIDTSRSEVMKAALSVGAGVVNDVTALEGDAASMAVVAQSSASVILMHMQGDPASMQDDPHYEEGALEEVYRYLEERIKLCQAAGVARERIAIDPGVGFGKTLEHNIDVLSRLEVFRRLGCPLALGVSRKSFIAALSKDEPPKDRLAGSLAAALAAVACGAQILRVHDVAETRQALDVWSKVFIGSK